MRPPSEPRLQLVHGASSAVPDDAALVRLSLGGSNDAKTLIFDRYSRLIRGVLRRSLGQNDVDDHVQEVFLRLFRQLPELRDAAVLRSFLIGIAMRVAGTELRRRKVRRWLTLTPSTDSVELETPPLDADAREALSHLYAILNRLDADSRLLFSLRYVERIELVELSSIFRVSLATLKRRLSRVSSRVFAMARRDELLLQYFVESSENRGEEP